MRMKFDILTLFPNMFSSPLRESILGKAIEKGLIQIRTVNIRDFTSDKHQVVDDTPYGGGQGMVMKVEPIARAIESVKSQNPSAWMIYLTPQGKPLHQDLARRLSTQPHLILLCGRYEGVDERVRESLVDEEISIGDYNSLLEYPQYTRPPNFRGHCVPEVLLSGNHSAISLWRRKEALRQTSLRRPDLLAKAELTEEDKKLLEEILKENFN